MKTYIAKSDFSIARDATNIIQISKGKRLEFDGDMVKMGGETYPLPKLGIAIRAKWLVPEDAPSTEYRPPKADIEIRGATPQQKAKKYQVVALREEERIVGSVGKAKEMREAREEADRAQTVSQRRPEAAPGIKMKVLNQEQQAETVVKTTFKNSAKTKIDMSSNSQTTLSTSEDSTVVTPIKKVATTQPEVEIQEVVVVAEVTQATLDGEESLPDIPEGLSPKERREWFAQMKTSNETLPDWDFSAHWTKKMTLLEEDITDKSMRGFIYELESEAIRKRMKKKLDL